MKWLQLKYEYERNEGHTTVYCFSHVAQMSKLPIAGFDEEPAVGKRRPWQSSIRVFIFIVLVSFLGYFRLLQLGFCCLAQLLFLGG